MVEAQKPGVTHYPITDSQVYPYDLRTIWECCICIVLSFENVIPHFHTFNELFICIRIELIDEYF